MDRLNDEIKQKEEQLQEERMERNKAEVELGREKDCNRVSASSNIVRLELQNKIIGDNSFLTWLCVCACALCMQVQLSETRRELQELKASLRVAQKEKEQLQAEKKAICCSYLTRRLISPCS